MGEEEPVEEVVISTDYVYCAGPHLLQSGKENQISRGPFRVKARIVNGIIGSRCPMCGKRLYTKEEKDDGNMLRMQARGE